MMSNMSERMDGWEKGWMDGRCKDIRARMNDGGMLLVSLEGVV